MNDTLVGSTTSATVAAAADDAAEYDDPSLRSLSSSNDDDDDDSECLLVEQPRRTSVIDLWRQREGAVSSCSGPMMSTQSQLAARPAEGSIVRSKPNDDDAASRSPLVWNRPRSHTDDGASAPPLFQKTKKSIPAQQPVAADDLNVLLPLSQKSGSENAEPSSSLLLSSSSLLLQPPTEPTPTKIWADRMAQHLKTKSAGGTEVVPDLWRTTEPRPVRGSIASRWTDRIKQAASLVDDDELGHSAIPRAMSMTASSSTPSFSKMAASATTRQAPSFVPKKLEASSGKVPFVARASSPKLSPPSLLSRNRNSSKHAASPKVPLAFPGLTTSWSDNNIKAPASPKVSASSWTAVSPASPKGTWTALSETKAALAASPKQKVVAPFFYTHAAASPKEDPLAETKAPASPVVAPKVFPFSLAAASSWSETKALASPMFAPKVTAASWSETKARASPIAATSPKVFPFAAASSWSESKSSPAASAKVVPFAAASWSETKACPAAASPKVIVPFATSSWSETKALASPAAASPKVVVPFAAATSSWSETKTFPKIARGNVNNRWSNNNSKSVGMTAMTELELNTTTDNNNNTMDHLKPISPGPATNTWSGPKKFSSPKESPGGIQGGGGADKDQKRPWTRRDVWQKKFKASPGVSPASPLLRSSFSKAAVSTSAAAAAASKPAVVTTAATTSDESTKAFIPFPFKRSLLRSPLDVSESKDSEGRESEEVPPQSDEGEKTVESSLPSKIVPDWKQQDVGVAAAVPASGAKLPKPKTFRKSLGDFPLLAKTTTTATTTVDDPSTSQTGGTQVVLSSKSSAFDAYNGDTAPKSKSSLVSLGRKHVKNGVPHKLATPSTIPVHSPNDDEYVSFGSVTNEWPTDSTREGKDVVDPSSAGPVHSEGLDGNVEVPVVRENENEVTPKRKTSNSYKSLLPNPRQWNDIQTKSPRVIQKPPPVFSPMSLGSDMSLSIDSGVLHLEPSSPTENIIAKKKQLQEQRRRGKQAWASEEGREIQPQTCSRRDKETAVVQSAPKSSPGSAWMDELLPINETKSVGRAAQPASNEQQQSTAPESTTLHATDSESLLSGMKAASYIGVVQMSPAASEGMQSELSFFSDSAFSGISRNSSVVSPTSGLANKAERLLKERRKNRTVAMSEEKAAALELAHNVAKGEDYFNTPNGLDRGSVVDGRSRRVDTQAESMPIVTEDSESPAEKLRREAGFSTRYIASSRFIENDRNAQNAPTNCDARSLEESIESGESSFHTQETASTESDSRYYDSSQAPPIRGRTTQKVRAPRERSKSLEAVPEQFMDESAANMEVFKKAFESVSLAQIASDWAGEVSMAGFDLKTLANNVNRTVQSFQGGKKGWSTSRSMLRGKDAVPFDEEDVAIEVEYLEDSASVGGDTLDDPATDLGGICAFVDGAVGLDDDTTVGIWPDDMEALKMVGNIGLPAGQSSFEERPSARKQRGARTGYV
jgi:hypothetical protein